MAPTNRPVIFVIVALLLASCSSPSSPEVPLGPDGKQDSVLMVGREVYSSSCARCHGASGQGTSRAPRLNAGRVIDQYPEIQDQIGLVTDGLSGMPALGDKYDDAEIEAVVRYTTEVLSVVDN